METDEAFPAAFVPHGALGLDIAFKCCRHTKQKKPFAVCVGEVKLHSEIEVTEPAKHSASLTLRIRQTAIFFGMLAAFALLPTPQIGISDNIASDEAISHPWNKSRSPLALPPTGYPDHRDRLVAAYGRGPSCASNLRGFLAPARTCAISTRGRACRSH